MDLIELAYKLRDIHKSVKGLYGDRWRAMVEEYAPQIRERATKENVSPTAAAIRWAHAPEVDPRLSLLILAVAVEMKP